MNNDKKAVRALKAAQTLIDYLNNEESFCSNSMWVDSKGYALHTDIGYLFEGLEKIADLLVKRCRGAIPEYPKLCAKYDNKQ
jgi:hypothetical protein